MNPIEEIKQRLVKYPQVEYKSDLTSVTVFPTTDDGFAVTLTVNTEHSYTVHFEGWHEEIGSAAEALNLFAGGLSTDCRLREYRRGNFAYKWTIEFKYGDEWIEQGTVGLLLIPFWRKRTIRLLQNNLIKTDAMDQRFVQLFSYGTLQDEAVQLATFGRRLKGAPDTLIGYRQTKIPVQDQPGNPGDLYYFNAEPTGRESDTVSGMRFEVTEPELEQADDYEASASYKRVLVELGSGTTAWVYVHADA